MPLQKISLIVLLVSISFQGVLPVFFAYKGEYDIVALCIGLSALFDFLDGMAARLLHAYSPMGKELDSLADLISFGLAPGFMAMHFMLYDSVFHGINDSYQIWWALSALLIPVFSALRLAKFNIVLVRQPRSSGCPSLPTLFFGKEHDQAGLQIEDKACGYAIVCLVILFSFLLISEIPMFSLKFKNLKLKENYLRYLILIAATIFLIFFGLAGLAATIGLYIILSLLTAKKH